MDVNRVLDQRRRGNGAGDDSDESPVNRDVFLEYLVHRRGSLIAELRSIERILVRERVLKSFSLPQKAK